MSDTETTSDGATDGQADHELALVDLDAGYGDLQVLHGVDLTLDAGEYVAVVGPNGAGKSTAMKSVFGLTDVTEGDVRFRGESLRGLTPEEITRKGISYVPQTSNVFPNLTVRENLRMGAYVRSELPEAGLETVFERFPILEERIDQKAGTMSGGQQQMLAMGLALVLDPDLLLLDEPSAGLAPDLVARMFDKVDEITESGTSVLMVEQNAVEALRRCDRGYVLVGGENRFADTGEALLANQDVRREFLGG
ncbi:ABC transporter ATP-binding protein [Salinigranum salinum]|uniref:ABC transporter ATP-binding protein n=1 Tax=Salinigranum salinum TaxID=1364937 RepID=UPI00126081A2|nr:ABC transporter ATP-binding protein [Salinigranum salinum]